MTVTISFFPQVSTGSIIFPAAVLSQPPPVPLLAAVPVPWFEWRPPLAPLHLGCEGYVSHRPSHTSQRPTLFITYRHSYSCHHACLLGSGDLPDSAPQLSSHVSG